MTTQTLEAGTIQAKAGKVGQEYLWINAKGEVGARTLLTGLKDGKAVVKFWVEGYEFETQAHTVSGTQLLKVVEDAPKPAAAKAQPSVQAKPAGKAPAKPEPTAKAPAKPKAVKAEKAPSTRIPKKAPGEKTPRVTLLGYSFRKDYRSRLSTIRAKFCEAAHKDKCNCRCAGSLHGMSHAPWKEAEDALFEKSSNGAITALQVLGLVKKFGGVKLPEPKPKGRKPAAETAEKAPAKSAVKPQAKAPAKATVKAQVKPQTKAVVKTTVPK